MAQHHPPPNTLTGLQLLHGVGLRPIGGTDVLGEEVRDDPVGRNPVGQVWPSLPGVPGPLVPTHTDWSEVPSSRLASCRRSVLLGARSRVCFSLVYSTVPPLARSLQAGVQCDPPRRVPHPGPIQAQDVPLEVPGKAQGDVGSAIVQLPLHLGPAWRADAPQSPGAALDLCRDDVLRAVLADELHGQLSTRQHLSGVRPNHPPAPQSRPFPCQADAMWGLLTGWGSNCLDSSS